MSGTSICLACGCEYRTNRPSKDHHCARCRDASSQEKGRWADPELLAADLKAQEPKKHSKYHREIKTGVFVDVYDVLCAWGVTNPALQHLIKKALQPGERGHKTLKQDMADIVASAKRAEELEK